MYYLKLWAHLLLTCLALALPLSGMAGEAGKFQFVAGSIKVISADGVERIPAKGSSFNAGETIVTGPNSSAQIRMTDGGLIAVRPDTQMTLDQFIFNGREDGKERALVSLVKGGFRAITGLIGNRNKQNYRILTPNATIGIRGTDHEPVVILPGAAGGAQAGTYDRVYRGATIIETEKGKLIVNPNQVGFTPGKGVAPVLLPKVPDFYETKPQKPDAANDLKKDSRESEGDSAKTDSQKTDGAKSTTARSLSTLRSDPTSLKESDGTTTTLRSPLDSTTVKDLGTTLKSDTLTTPLSDTTLRSTTLQSDSLISPVKTEAATTVAPTTTLRSTDALTTPISTTTSTLKSTTTSTTTTLKSTTTPITTITAPTTTTTIPRVTETVTTPLTTTIPKTTTILTKP